MIKAKLELEGLETSLLLEAVSEGDEEKDYMCCLEFLSCLNQGSEIFDIACSKIKEAFGSDFLEKCIYVLEGAEKIKKSADKIDGTASQIPFSMPVVPTIYIEGSQ